MKRHFDVISSLSGKEAPKARMYQKTSKCFDSLFSELVLRLYYSLMGFIKFVGLSLKKDLD